MPTRFGNWKLTSSSIIFVHGVGSHAVGSWTTANGGCFWPKDLLGRDFSRCRIMVSGFDASIKVNTSTSRLPEFGKQLVDRILSSTTSEKVRTSHQAESKVSKVL